jgi:processing peptidase subunit alpha
LVQNIELIGGQVSSQANREFLMYQGSVFPEHVPQLVHLLSQIVKDPLLKSTEIEETKESTKYELDNLKWNTEQSLPELLHSIAFRKKSSDSLLIKRLDELQLNTLGRSTKILPSNLATMDKQKLDHFRNMWFTPDRMVLVGIGVDHELLLNLAEIELGSIQQASPELKKLQQESSRPASYSGGIFIQDTTGLEKNPNPDQMTLTHVQIAYETMSITDPDIYSLATLGQLLGGGGSFSAGGPGKGMYTRLYTQVLNRNGWIESCNVINYTYQDSGLFGITASVPSDPATHQHIASVILDQLVTCTNMCTLDELGRAKNQLKSNLLMSLESQPIELEDVGRQILAHGRRLDVNEMCKRIDLVTCADLIRVARRTFLGEHIPSPYEFNDGICKPWVPSGDGSPTVLVQGPLTGKRDGLFEIERSLSKWGLLNSDTSIVGRKPSFFKRF